MGGGIHPKRAPSAHPVAQPQPLFVQSRGVLHWHTVFGGEVGAIAAGAAGAATATAWPSGQTAYMSTASTPPIPKWHRL